MMHCYVFDGGSRLTMMHLQIYRFVIVFGMMAEGGPSSSSSAPDYPRMIQKKIQLPSSLEGRMELTVEYDTQFSSRRCVISLEHTVNLNTGHTIMCCINPTKTVSCEEGWKLKLVFERCDRCDRCKSNMFLSSFGPD